MMLLKVFSKFAFEIPFSPDKAFDLGRASSTLQEKQTSFILC